MSECPRSTYTLPQAMDTVIPQVTITADFLTGNAEDSGETVEESITIQDVTASTAHAGTTTRLLHIMFESNDMDTNLKMLQGMAADFRCFYNRLRNAKGPAGVNPLALPRVDDDGPDWWTGLQEYIQSTIDLILHDSLDKGTSDTTGGSSSMGGMPTPAANGMATDMPAPAAGTLDMAAPAAGVSPPPPCCKPCLPMLITSVPTDPSLVRMIASGVVCHPCAGSIM